LESDKSQITNKYQISKSKYQNRFGNWKFVISNLFEIWDLCFGILEKAGMVQW
jgi:hypothetical protein